MPELSIDALNPAGTKAWRLQTDHGWRRARFAEPLRGGDFATTEPDEARPWLAGRVGRDRGDGLAWEAAPGREAFAPGEVSLHAIAHRHQAPPLPEREDLRAVLAGAETTGRRTLCLDLEGRFLLREPAGPPVGGDPALAAHGDSLSGSGYLGPGAAADTAYVDEHYRNFLGAWYQHLRSGRVSVYAGEPLWDLPAAELAERIRGWEPTE